MLTSVGAAHLEGLGGLAGVAREKGDLLRALPAEGLAFLPEGSVPGVALSQLMSVWSRVTPNTVSA